MFIKVHQIKNKKYNIFKHLIFKVFLFKINSTSITIELIIYGANFSRSLFLKQFGLREAGPVQQVSEVAVVCAEVQVGKGQLRGRKGLKNKSLFFYNFGIF